jgi:hypothetical protein
MRTWGPKILASFLLLAAIPAWGRVFLQWSESAIPPAASIGVKELVISWGTGKIQMMNAAKERGYRVFAKVDLQDAGAAADAATANGLAGIIVESESDEPGQRATYELVQRLRRSHPGLSVLELDPGGKQPQIRGNMVVKRYGVLEVSSSTQQPWVDSNVALARFERAIQPGQSPLFSFSWDLTDPLERQQGPRAADYALAVAEAGAIHADVILPVHPHLQKALAEGNKTAWREWNQVKTYVKFYSKMRSHRAEPWADIAAVTDNYQSTYEAMNLLARHNIPFQVLRPVDMTAQRVSRLQLVIVFSKPEELAVRLLQAFSSAGGTVVLVNQQGRFPWDVLPGVKRSDGTSYKVGRGEIVELTEPVGDPEAFAEQIRGLLNKQDVLIYFWNALTTLGFAYPTPKGGNMTLELVNYAQEPLQVQVRVKGSFSNIRYETPGHGFYAAIPPEHDNGFTEFVVSHLRIGGRVYLSPEEKHEKAKELD